MFLVIKLLTKIYYLKLEIKEDIGLIYKLKILLKSIEGGYENTISYQ